MQTSSPVKLPIAYYAASNDKHCPSYPCPNHRGGLPCAHALCSRGSNKREIVVDGQTYKRAKDEDGWYWRLVE